MLVDVATVDEYLLARPDQISTPGVLVEGRAELGVVAQELDCLSRIVRVRGPFKRALRGEKRHHTQRQQTDQRRVQRVLILFGMIGGRPAGQ